VTVRGSAAPSRCQLEHQLPQHWQLCSRACASETASNAAPYCALPTSITVLLSVRLPVQRTIPRAAANVRGSRSCFADIVKLFVTCSQGLPLFIVSNGSCGSEQIFAQSNIPEGWMVIQTPNSLDAGAKPLYSWLHKDTQNRSMSWNIISPIP